MSVTTFVCRHAIPKVLLTDNGSNFVSKMFEDMCKLLKIKHIKTAVYRPQSNGQIERWHRSLSQYIRAYAEGELSRWCEWIPYALLTHNSTPHSATKYTPHELVYGFKLEIPSAIENVEKVEYNYDDYTNILRNRVIYATKMARENIIREKELRKEQYDKNINPINLQVGNMVWKIKEKKLHKFEDPYAGPYYVLGLPSEETCEIQVGRKTERVHRNKLKLYTGDEMETMKEAEEDME